MSKIKLQILILCNLLLLCIIVFFFVFKSKNEIVYVESERIFNDFLMTKEMKRLGEREFNSQKFILDTLYKRIQSPTISDDERKKLMPTFLQGRENLESLNKNFAIEESKKIWSRIRAYSKQFSEDKGYELIIGSDNNQSVLYAGEKTDVTNELLLYINSKYEGNK